MVACMAAMAREAWTDERLDDLRENVNQRFDAVDKRFDRMEAEVQAGFAKVDRRFAAVDARLDSLQRTMIVCFVGTIGTIVVSVLGGILATQP